jgi:hypothetical protein
VNIPHRSISGIKLKFRKQVINYNAGYEGTRKYFDDLGLQRELRKRKGIQKRLYTCHKRKYPYRCKSKKTYFSRHEFTTIDELHAAVKAKLLLAHGVTHSDKLTVYVLIVNVTRK